MCLFYWSHRVKHAVKKGTNTQCIVCADSTEQSEVKEKKYCLCCGADISHQKKESKYCSHNRKCRDKAYNLKVSEKRKANKTKKEKDIINLIDKLGSQLKLTKTTNPNRKKTKGIPSRKTSIIVTINGTRKMYHGSAARFFLNEFEKKTDESLTNTLSHETNCTWNIAKAHKRED